MQKRARIAPETREIYHLMAIRLLKASGVDTLCDHCVGVTTSIDLASDRREHEAGTRPVAPTLAMGGPMTLASSLFDGSPGQHSDG